MKIWAKILYSSSLFLRLTVRSILSRIWSPLDLQRILSLYSTGAYPKILFIFCQNMNFTFWANFAISISWPVAFFASFVARFAVKIVVYKMVSRALVTKTTRVSFMISKMIILESGVLTHIFSKISCFALTNPGSHFVSSSDASSLVAANFSFFVRRAAFFAAAAEFCFVWATVFHLFHAEFFSQTEYL